DLVFLLQGDGVKIVLTGNTQIKGGVTYSRFKTIPDQPISSFELNLPEGPYAVLGAITNLCKPTTAKTVTEKVKRRVNGKLVTAKRKVAKQVAEPLVMPTTITGQNGAVFTQSTKIAVTGCAKAKPAKKAKKAKKNGKKK
ncbi:MAG TPA: hypothetical protein VK680_03870, partial [Solirubrobacteraceae bacterium]|nr:hypothetical protein [Solirubrobacteraceae bacterium]